MQSNRCTAALLVVIGLTSACTHKTEVPPLAGPSALAQSLSLTATPDAISQDGASQSSILVTVTDTSGRPMSGLSIRLEMRVGGTIQDFGTLSTKNVVTGSDGKASAVYTAPPPPPPNSTIGTCGTLASGQLTGPCVTIVATATGTNSQAATARTVDIRLVPPGVILPPAGTPKATFTMLPSSGTGIGQSMSFDGSASCANLGSTGACTTAGSIVSFAWDFGDGSAGSGMRTVHAFSTGGNFVVTLTVINDTSGVASASQQVAISLPAPPAANFVVSPGAPATGQSIFFDATTSTSAFGHNIVQYNWNFGDGASATGITARHTYLAPGVYNVVLSVIDDTGQRATLTVQVTVT